MMSEQPQTTFDAKPVIREFIGTWRFSAPGMPGQMGLIHFSENGRAIQCLFDPTDPEKGIWMRLWYFIESPNTIRFSYENDDKGWRRTYQLAGGTITLRGVAESAVFTRALPNRIPEWFSQSIVSAAKRAV
jgi:hypothetical protein